MSEIEVFHDPVSLTPLVREESYFSNRTSPSHRYPVVEGIPRFISPDHYSAAFGLQWKSFPQVQVDSKNGHKITRQRLLRCLGEPIEALKGKWVLEAGCGSGRFSEVMLEGGARLCAVDASVAVEPHRQNLGSKYQYYLAQADIYALPFRDEYFDYVVCLGVLQHLPDPEAGIRSLFRKLKPGGKLIIDHYTSSWKFYLKLHWVYRLFLRRLKPETSKRIVDWLVGVFYPLHWKLRNSKLGTMILNRVSPCLTYFQHYPELSPEQQRQFCHLDTYDSLTDFYKHLRSTKQIRKTLESLGAVEIEVWKGGNGVEARCRKKLNSGH